MLVHCRATPSSKFACTHLYTWVERRTVRVECLVQEHHGVTPLQYGHPFNSQVVACWFNCKKCYWQIIMATDKMLGYTAATITLAWRGRMEVQVRVQSVSRKWEVHTLMPKFSYTCHAGHFRLHSDTGVKC